MQARGTAAKHAVRRLRRRGNRRRRTNYFQPRVEMSSVKDVASAGASTTNRMSLVVFGLSLAAGVGAYRSIGVVQDGGVWALITVTAGVFALLHAGLGVWRARQHAADTWPAWPAALIAVATLAAGSAGAAASRRSADALAQFVDQAFAGPDRDEEEVAIQTAHVRATGYGAGRTCAWLGLGLGGPSLLLGMALLQRARTSRKRQQVKANGASPGLWMSLCGVTGAVALTGAIAAAARPVPAAEHPDKAEAALIERRFASGDLPSACRLLAGALQTTTEQAQREAEARLTEVRAKASRCVDWELAQARKLGPSGCAAAIELLASKRLVQVSGRSEALAGACDGLQ